MNTQEQTIKAIIGFVQNRIQNGKKNEKIIRDQMDAATTKAQLRLWENESERHIGRMQSLKMLEESLWLFYEHPETLNGLEK